VIDLAGKAAVVTGGSRGVGLAVTVALAKHGMRVLAVARSFGNVFEAACTELGDGAARVDTLSVDLLDGAARASVIPEALRRFGGLDALVNNAGIVRYARLDGASAEDLRAQFELNVFAPHELSVAALPALRRSQGAIVNVASTLAFRPAEFTGAYGGTKAALVAMTKTLALEEARHQVRVNAVAPGILDTDMIRARDPKTGITAAPESLGALHPVGRLGTPDEIAESVVFLLRSPWTTGTTLTIDGGLSL
jgi:3-oxoacyl-[acyl-carrier protein] reductase